MKLFAKDEKEFETRINSEDRGMEFGIEKCPRLIMRSGKRQMMERRELSNQKDQKTWKKRNL